VLVPPSFRSILDHLEKASHLQLVVCFSVEELVVASGKERCAILLLPADHVVSHEWWALWGAVSILDPRPSILVYALKSDFRIWAGVLAAGGLDVITAPFTISPKARAVNAPIECARLLESLVPQPCAKHARVRPGRRLARVFSKNYGPLVLT
jgi:hypothetical protein